MSAASDKFERDVAKNINAIPGIKAERPQVSTGYADVRVTYKKKTSWLEVKMNHTDNLSNPRVFYSDGKWQTTYTTPAAKFSVQLLNKSAFTKNFLYEISKFSRIPLAKIQIPTNKGGLKNKYAVPLIAMKEYFDQPTKNRYIVTLKDIDIGKLVTEHYTIGKDEPAYYMQAADDFYQISKTDPFGICKGKKVPVLSGYGDFKIRVATRSEFYEVQAEIKIKKMPHSEYSLAPKTKKLNPFLV